MSVLKNRKDEIASLVAIFSLLAILFGVWQFYLTREAVQAQAIGSSLSHGRDLYGDLLDNPEVARRLFGAKSEGLDEALFVQKVLSFFSEQYVYYEGWLMDHETWSAVKKDMCKSYNSEGFKALADGILDRGSFPQGFVTSIRECVNG